MSVHRQLDWVEGHVECRVLKCNWVGIRAKLCVECGHAATPGWGASCVSSTYM